MTSPSASGPAGTLFEAQVGASYLLALLVGSEPRGLSGTSIEAIECQRSGEGRALDDVIVRARDNLGNPAILEIQVKRTIEFTPSDAVFRDVVGQVAKASRHPEFEVVEYQLAVATARTSRKIDGPYQDVLTWARELGDSETFLARINRLGSANTDMRTFVSTFRSHLGVAGVASDDETVWRILRRFQILVFDFTAQGSVAEELAKERAVRALHSEDGAQSSGLWSTLISTALQAAATGGGRTRNDLSDELGQLGFRLAGARRFASARATLAEASRHALGDIVDRVGGVMLTRHELVGAIHAALDTGRYVEIRGDAGVGKSGLLKHLARQIGQESAVIVLSPGRIIQRGWIEMRATLGFDGSARDLLSDLAGDGGAVIFVDNLDFFKDDEKTTVIDLIREAATVPGVAVVATARRGFGTEEPSWLPREALDLLGRAEPIVVAEVSEKEIAEIQHAAPRLAFLLAENHPAQSVARNLFRLDRLAGSAASEPLPRSEVDMSERWWKTADGNMEEGLRERSRVLKWLAEQALDRAERLDVSTQHPSAVNALVRSETLRDLGGDQVVFRHDVLREWAIANLLHQEPERIDRLPLRRPAPPAFSRGVEIATRMNIERASDSMAWQSLLERLSQGDVHGSWRRAVLLGLARSEISQEVLDRAADYLLDNGAAVLRELIRLVIAVDSEPAARLFAALGVDPTSIPTGMSAPSGPSWIRLIAWILSRSDRLPGSAVPDVVDLYTAWSSGMLGIDPLTPVLQKRLYAWLNEIETARDSESFTEVHQLFGGDLDYERVRTLESDIRNAFVLFANRTPDLAREYLSRISQRRHHDDLSRSILKFRGALARTAPMELAELTANALIQKPEAHDRHGHRDRREVFGYIDLEFLPASPSQGPFLELLTHGPEHGLVLTRKLVDHAIKFYSGGRDPGKNEIVLPLPDGDRIFSWKQSYAWSRDANGHYGLTSALMALEAWGHGRIEAGENVQEVVDKVLGPIGAPAAYLLVAVDLILSHWPKTRDLAIPFLACPELLCLDRERQAHDVMEYPDLFGLKALQREPVGSVSSGELTKRPSRRLSLENALHQVGAAGPAEIRDQIVVLLHRAAKRLGAPDTEATLADPSFMALHALNVLDPANWKDATVTLEDGSTRSATQYVSPETEGRHLAALQSEIAEQHADTNMQLTVSNVVDNPTRSSPQFAATASGWAQSRARTGDDRDAAQAQEVAIVCAALISIRDGEPELRSANADWVRRVFAEALLGKEDATHRFRSGLRFNPVGMAFAGLAYLAKDSRKTEDIRKLLEIAAQGDPAAAHGLAAAETTLISIDERLPRSVLRCALASCDERRLSWSAEVGEREAVEATKRNQMREHVDTEMAWLSGSGSEPKWPAFPDQRPHRRPGVRIPGGPPRAAEPEHKQSDVYVDHQAAALWLASCRQLKDVQTHPWVGELVRAYNRWTMMANGAGLERHEDINNSPREWNRAYFDLLAHALTGLSPPEIDSLVLEPMASLPDKTFFDAVTEFVRDVDAVYFGGSGLPQAVAITIRTRLADRLMNSSGWRRTVGRRSSSIEHHIGPAIGALLFNQHGFGQDPTCYLRPPGIDRLTPFLPLLETLVKDGASLFVALATMNLLEISPRSEQLPLLVVATNAWLQSYPDYSDFWVDHGIGRRVCTWIDVVRSQDPTQFSENSPSRSEIDRLVAALVRVGVVEARRLEQALLEP